MRTIVCIVLLALSVMAPQPTRADDAFPSRPVRVIVAFPPGSTLDALTRIVGDQLARKWAQPVVIENISGGGGTIGTEKFARSEPDGYTVMFSPPGPLTINPLLYGASAPDPSNFIAITLMATVPNVLLVRRPLAADTVADVIALAKANRGKLTYASQGVGSTTFLTAKLFETRAGIEMVHVPYRGAGPALNDIVAGHVDLMFDTIVTSSPLHRNGTAKILAVASTERSQALPDLPTIAETLPGFRSASFFACVAPANTPPAIAAKLNKDIVAVLRQPDVYARLRDIMLEPVGSTPEETGRFLASEAALWGRIVKETNATGQ
jgi:tripartite-type tricarboxylate transporter receptor subunit TctC